MRVLTVIAHPDDEVLWCWPAVQQVHNERAVLAVCDNKRTYGENALKAFYGLGKALGWDTCCLHLDSEFYRLPYRRADVVLPDVVAKIRADLLNKIESWRPDVVFTHNPVGEYGHGDHRLTAEIVYTTSPVRVWTTDICCRNKAHVSYENIPGHVRQMLQPVVNLATGKALDAIRLDVLFFKIAANTYQKFQAWSWSGDVAAECGIYEVKR